MVLIHFLMFNFLDDVLGSYDDTISKKRTICKIDYWSNKYMEDRDSEKEKKRRISTSKQAALACLSYFLTFLILQKNDN